MKVRKSVYKFAGNKPELFLLLQKPEFYKIFMQKIFKMTIESKWKNKQACVHPVQEEEKVA